MHSLPNGKSIPIPTPDFNVIFQLSHILRHYIYEGISLKQLVDYFYVLKEHHAWKKSHGCKAEDDILSTLSHLGMCRFASVIMYVMNVFGLKEDYLFTKMNEKGGKIILDSIVNEEDVHSSSLHNMNDLSRYNSVRERQKIKLHRLIKLFPYFPGETIWGFFPRIVRTFTTSQ